MQLPAAASSLSGIAPSAARTAEPRRVAVTVTDPSHGEPRFDATAVSAASFPHPVVDVKRVETHISWVFLTGRYAYKVKKPVRFDYLDFSTLERRRYFCQRELTLNRRLAPELYLDVVPIGGSPDAPQFGASPAFDYAVRMREFADAARLDRVLVSGRFDDELADLLGETLAGLHAAAAVAPVARQYGSVTAVIAPLIDNFRELRAALDGSYTPRVAEQCRHDIALARRVRPAIRKRRRSGRVRDCHGDLHLANMILDDGRIVPFDRLEFDPTLRWIDVFNEVAFPFADLVVRNRIDLAFGFVNRYLERTGDYDGLMLLPLYAGYKALIRAKIAAASNKDELPGVDDWLQAARRLSRTRARRLVLMHGLPCSGKSSVASELMRGLPAIRVRSDVERKRLAGLRAEASSGSDVGGGLYSDRQSNATYDRLANLSLATVTAGYDVVVDATFRDRAERRRFVELADDAGLAAVIVECVAPIPTLRARLAARAATAGNVSEASDAVLDWQLERRQELSRSERALTVECDTTRPVDRTELVTQIVAASERR